MTAGNIVVKIAVTSPRSRKCPNTDDDDAHL
jgi:hypothetical protein